MSEETLLEFPCQFSIKVMGTNHANFENEVVMIIRQHIPNLGEAENASVRLSCKCQAFTYCKCKCQAFKCKCQAFIT